MRPRNQSLDVLRALAVFLTMGIHFPVFATLHRAGWIGVDLFFVLSGYLISGLLFQEFHDTGGIRIGRFILRRGFKIWPPFYALILGTMALLMVVRVKFSIVAIALNAFFLQNYFYFDPRFKNLLLYHTWSLAVEEHFYLALPLLLAGMILLAKFTRSSQPFRWIPGISAGVLVLCTILRRYDVFHAPFAATHLNMDFLFAGVALGYLRHFRFEAFRRMAAWPVIIVVVLCCFPPFVFESNSRWFQFFGVTLLIIGFTFLVAWAVSRDPAGLFGQRAAEALATVGRYSYSIYLWHVMLAKLLFTVPSPSVWRFLIYVVISIAVGVVASEMIERPFLVLRKKWFPESSNSARSAVPNAISLESEVVRAN